jgi:long-chain acyl-CoA synthetase
LAPARNMFPEEIEDQYRRSAFIQEFCVIGLDPRRPASAAGLYAVVVPNMALVRARKIVNIGDLLRFEIEGQSVYLPPHSRVADYEIWFDALPRTPSGSLKRQEIEQRVRDKARRAADAQEDTPARHIWTQDPHAAAVAAIIERRSKSAPVRPEANLELDIGLDSMERVELIAELEQRFNARVPEERAHEILTVQQLIEAVRGHAAGAPDSVSEEPWALLLRDSLAVNDPLVAPLVAKRRVMPLLFFCALRLGRLVFPRTIVTGLEHLPANGPYILTPNHQSFLDPFFLGSVLPYRVFTQLFFVGASEYFETRLTAWLARQFNLVPVDPDANLVSAMKAAAFGLRRGKILVLFPEGERSIDGTVKRFKKGAAILSRHMSVPIVPVAIRGVFDVWPRNRPFNWRVLLPGHRHRIHVRVSAPLPPSDDIGDAQAAKQLREQIAALWDACPADR